MVNRERNGLNNDKICEVLYVEVVFETVSEQAGTDKYICNVSEFVLVPLPR